MKINNKYLKDLRSTLLPTLFSYVAPDLDIEIIVDSKTRSLLVKGFCRTNRKSLGFAVTKQSISDGSYKPRFRGQVEDLVGLLRAK